MAVDPDSFAQICDSLDRFVRERLIPNEERVEAEDEVPPEIVEAPRLGSLCFHPSLLPAFRGGTGVGKSGRECALSGPQP